jgi:hypothetical protein
MASSHPHAMLDPDHPSNNNGGGSGSSGGGGGGSSSSSGGGGSGGGGSAGDEDRAGAGGSRGFDDKHALSAAQKLLLDDKVASAPGGEEMCFGAPKPWVPLAAANRRRQTLSFNLDNATSMIEAVARMGEDAAVDDAVAVSPRRSLSAFKTASLVRLALTPGCQIGYMERTERRQLNRVLTAK